MPGKLNPRLLVLLFVGAAIAAACAPSPVCDSVYTVNKTADTNDGVCSATDCSLREAIDNANACPGPQTIKLPPATYPLTLAGPDDDTNATGDLDITDDLTILGEAVPSINGINQDRIFEVFSSATVVMDHLLLIGGKAQMGGAIRNHGDLTIRGGSIHHNVAAVPPGGAGASSGGGIFNEAGTLRLENTQIFSNEADEGGGIYNLGTATLIAENVLLAGNTASAKAGGLWNNAGAQATLTNVEIRMNTAAFDAGGIFNDGLLEATGITFEENEAATDGGGLHVGANGSSYLYDAWFTNNSAGRGGALFNRGMTHLYQGSLTNNSGLGGQGGGAYNDFGGALLMRNVTVSSNLIDAPAGLPGGSGIFNLNDMRLEFVTVAYNNRDGIRNDAGGHFTIESSVLAYHSLGNCTGPSGMASNGFNLADDDTCGLIEPSDMSGVNPLLGSLAANGGNGLSHLPAAGSPAIDSGDPDTCIATDQRGVSRPQGAGCDRGSIEVEFPAGVSTPVPYGTVSGAVCYPSEGIPPLTLYFENTSDQSVASFSHTNGLGVYSVDLDPGTYVAYAYRNGTALAGSYSQAVLCGLTVNCTDHSLVPFTVLAGQETTDIDICDWYGQPGDVPEPPGGLPVTPTPSPTPQVTPMAWFTMNAFCRKGPGTVYDTATAFEQGREVELIGRSEPGLPPWWLTEFRCWVSDATVETSGPVEALPVFPAPPTPTPVVPPQAPARFRITDRVCNDKLYRVSLGWIDQASNEDGYRLYRDGSLIATLGANATSYEDNPPRGEVHTYSLEAFNSGGASTQVRVQNQGCK